MNCLHWVGGEVAGPGGAHLQKKMHWRWKSHLGTPSERNGSSIALPPSSHVTFGNLLLQTLAAVLKCTNENDRCLHFLCISGTLRLLFILILLMEKRRCREGK